MASTAVRGMVRLGHRRVQTVTAAEKMLNLRPSTLYFASTAVRGMVRLGHRRVQAVTAAEKMLNLRPSTLFGKHSCGGHGQVGS